MPKIAYFKLVVFLISLSAGLANAEGTTTPIQSEYKEIKSMKEVEDVVLKATTDTLVIFDIDDTLLTSPAFEGSDYWYEWQSKLMENDPQYIPCKFDVIAINYEMGTQQPVESETPALVNALKNANVNLMYLTARNSAYRGATERELKWNRYPQPNMLIPSNEGIIFQWSNPNELILKDVSYWNGIYMVSGLGKGEALYALLEKLRIAKRFNKVILIDDGLRNIKSMQTAMGKYGISYMGYHYTPVNKSLPAPKEKTDAAIASWQMLKQHLNDTFPRRGQDFDTKQCNY